MVMRATPQAPQKRNLFKKEKIDRNMLYSLILLSPYFRTLLKALISNLTTSTRHWKRVVTNTYERLTESLCTLFLTFFSDWLDVLPPQYRIISASKRIFYQGWLLSFLFSLFSSLLYCVWMFFFFTKSVYSVSILLRAFLPFP